MQTVALLRKCWCGLLKLILLQLYKEYPDMPMMLYLHASKPPTMTMTGVSVNLTIPAHVNVSVVDTKNGNITKPAFTIGLVSSQYALQC